MVVPRNQIAIEHPIEGVGECHPLSAHRTNGGEDAIPRFGDREHRTHRLRCSFNRPQTRPIGLRLCGLDVYR